MSDLFSLDAKSRADVGKGASRRLRRLENLIPAIVYGGKKEPVNITLDHDNLWHHLENEAFFSHIIKLSVDGSSEDVLLKDLQRHPAKNRIMHADFMRVDADQAVVVRVPLHFINEESCVGVKMGGGKITHSANDIEVKCLPKYLPEYIEVDMIDVEIGHVVHLSDVKLPEGVESVELSHGGDHDQAIANVALPKGGSEDDEEEVSDDGGEEPTATEE